MREMDVHRTVAVSGATMAPNSFTILLAAADFEQFVGMEDTLTFEPGRPVRDNAELVERAATLATLALRPPMTTDEARALLNVKDRRNGVGA